MAERLDDYEAYRLYKHETIESQGFYVPNNYGRTMPRGIVWIKKEDEVKYKKAECAAKFAVEKYNNEKNKKLIFEEIINFNMQPAVVALYYITFTAKESSSDEVGIYEAKVLEKLHSGFDVQIFRNPDGEGHDTTSICVKNFQAI